MTKTSSKKPIRPYDQCTMVSINGVACHGHGCPNLLAEQRRRRLERD